MNLREALAKVRNAGYNPQINENIEYVDPESNYGNPFLDEYGDPAIDELKSADIKELSDEDKKYWIDAFDAAITEFPDDTELNDLVDIRDLLESEVNTDIDESFVNEGNVKNTLEKLEDGSDEEMIDYFEELADKSEAKMKNKT